MKKLGYVVTAAVAASAAAAIGFAPLASADATVQSTPGNTQIVATPGPAAQEAASVQQPFGGDYGALLFHNH
jgi:hypothetical protein